MDTFKSDQDIQFINYSEEAQLLQEVEKRENEPISPNSIEKESIFISYLKQVSRNGYKLSVVYEDPNERDESEDNISKRG